MKSLDMAPREGINTEMSEEHQQAFRIAVDSLRPLLHVPKNSGDYPGSMPPMGIFDVEGKRVIVMKMGREYDAEHQLGITAIREVYISEIFPSFSDVEISRTQEFKMEDEGTGIPFLDYSEHYFTKLPGCEPQRLKTADWILMQEDQTKMKAAFDRGEPTYMPEYPDNILRVRREVAELEDLSGASWDRFTEGRFAEAMYYLTECNQTNLVQRRS